MENYHHSPTDVLVTQWGEIRFEGVNIFQFRQLVVTRNSKCFNIKNFHSLFIRRQRGGGAIAVGSVTKERKFVKFGGLASYWGQCEFEPHQGSG